MTEQEPVNINYLIGTFTDLQEQWESNPDGFDWTPLQALAREGAHAYNDGAGPSFHALALDGVVHGEFHARFLGYLLDAGFDPFRLGRAGQAPDATLPLIDHASLASAASSNPASARMHAMLMEAARARFGPMIRDMGETGMAESGASSIYKVFAACAESIPAELLQKIAPELAKSHRDSGSASSPPSDEGYLSAPESIVDRARPQG